MISGRCDGHPVAARTQHPLELVERPRPEDRQHRPHRPVEHRQAIRRPDGEPTIGNRLGSHPHGGLGDVDAIPRGAGQGRHVERGHVVALAAADIEQRPTPIAQHVADHCRHQVGDRPIVASGKEPAAGDERVRRVATWVGGGEAPTDEQVEVALTGAVERVAGRALRPGRRVVERQLAMRAGEHGRAVVCRQRRHRAQPCSTSLNVRSAGPRSLMLMRQTAA